MSPRTVRGDVMSSRRAPCWFERRGRRRRAGRRSRRSARGDAREHRRARVDAHRCGGPGRLAHRHRPPHRAHRGVGVVRGREAAPGVKRRPPHPDDERSNRGTPTTSPSGTLSALSGCRRHVVLDGRPAQRYIRRRSGSAPRTSSRVKPARPRGRGASRAPRSGTPRPSQRRPFVPGHAIDEEPGVLQRLALAGELRVGEEPWIGRRFRSVPSGPCAVMGTRVITVAATPSMVVTWSLPSCRGRSYSPARPPGHPLVEPSLSPTRRGPRWPSGTSS